MNTDMDHVILNTEEETARLLRVAGREGIADHYAGKRSFTRFAVGMLIEITADPSCDSASQPATLHNISDGGFAFWSKRQVPIKTRIYAREFSEGNSRLWLPAQVTHCTTGIRGFLVGARIEFDMDEE